MRAMSLSNRPAVASAVIAACLLPAFATGQVFWNWNDPTQQLMGWTAFAGSNLHRDTAGYITIDPALSSGPNPDSPPSWQVQLYHNGHGFDSDQQTGLVVDVYTANGVNPELGLELDWYAPGVNSGQRRAIAPGGYSAQTLSNGWTRYLINDFNQWTGNGGPDQMYLTLTFDSNPGRVHIDNWGSAAYDSLTKVENYTAKQTIPNSGIFLDFAYTTYPSNTNSILDELRAHGIESVYLNMGQFGSDGTLINQLNATAVAQFVDAAHASSRSINVYGWMNDYTGGPDGTSTDSLMNSNHASEKALVANTISNWVRDYDLDGLVIDVEPLGDATPDRLEEFADFLNTIQTDKQVLLYLPNVAASNASGIATSGDNWHLTTNALQTIAASGAVDQFIFDSYTKLAEDENHQGFMLPGNGVDLDGYRQWLDAAIAATTSTGVETILGVGIDDANDRGQYMDEVLDLTAARSDLDGIALYIDGSGNADSEFLTGNMWDVWDAKVRHILTGRESTNNIFLVGDVVWNALAVISSTGATNTNNGALEMQTGSPAWISQLVQLDASAQWLMFDLDFTSEAGAEGVLSVFLDGELLGTVDERFAADGLDTYQIDLNGLLAAGAHELAFRLDPFTEVSSTVLIDNVSFAAFHAGDANGDGQVNLADLQILGDNWQSTVADWSLADFTGDSVVDLADLQILGDNWGFGAALDMTFDQAIDWAGINVPEPGGLVLLGAGSLLMVGAHKKREPGEA